MTKGLIHSVESFGAVDGPGIRYVIFTKGCRMRCRFCHNPDTWSLESDNKTDQWLTPQEVLEKALRFKTYWRDKGGITVSGGEPLLQIDFLTELFQMAKTRGSEHRTRHGSGAIHKEKPSSANSTR